MYKEQCTLNISLSIPINKFIFFIVKLFFFFICYLLSCQIVIGQIVLKQSIGENITPKSIIHDGRGLFSAQNMMYKHTVSIYSSQGALLKTIPDIVNLNQFGYSEYKDALYRGAPVEACFTPDGKYLWVSNYAMYGPGFNKEGCDGCSGDYYDPSFLYKINTINYQIESVVKVGSVPKYLTISNNGKLLLVSNWTSSDVSIIDLEKEQEISRVNVGPRPRGIVVDNKNQKAYVAIMGSNKIGIINLLDFSVKYIDNIGRAPRHLILNKSNSKLYVAVNSANKLAKVNLLNQEVKFCSTKPGPRSMVLSSNEQYLYVVNYHANTFQKINAETMTIVETIKTMQKPIGIAGDWRLGNVWVSCYSGKIQIFHDPELSISSPKQHSKPKQNSKPKYYAYMPKIKFTSLLLSMMKIKPLDEKNDGFITATDLKSNLKKSSSLPYQQDLSTNNEAYAYSVIVGSFLNGNNAKKFQALLLTQNLSSFVLPSSNGKMTMVAVGKFMDSKKATNQLKVLKLEHDLNAWIYKKG